MPKVALRNMMLARRRGLSDEEVRERSESAQASLLQLPQFRQSGSIALYAPIHREVDTRRLLDHALLDGKSVCFPAVAGDALEFRRVGGEADLQPGAFGILEPLVGAAVLHPFDIDLIVVPGVAFDVHGRRIGYGKGYYDRALHALEGEGRLVGFCFDFQLLNQLIDVPHDVKLDGIVTEHRVIFPCD